MNRRAFIGTLAAGLLAAPLAAETQQAGKVWRIGYLSYLERGARANCVRQVEVRLHDPSVGVPPAPDRHGGRSPPSTDRQKISARHGPRNRSGAAAISLFCRLTRPALGR